MTDITTIATHASISTEPLPSDVLHTVFASSMTNMLALDLAIGLVILIAHRWFLINERKENAAALMEAQAPQPAAPAARPRNSRQTRANTITQAFPVAIANR